MTIGHTGDLPHPHLDDRRFRESFRSAWRRVQRLRFRKRPSAKGGR